MSQYTDKVMATRNKLPTSYASPTTGFASSKLKQDRKKVIDLCGPQPAPIKDLSAILEKEATNR